MATQPRGLANFISDIRNATSKDDERVRIDKELANIRLKFTASASLNSYQKKKYVWKMCYIYMLGYEVDFGHVEIISLLSSPKFQEKSVGYMAVAMLVKPEDEMMKLVVNSMRNDIVGNLAFGKTLALSALANIGGMGLADALGREVEHLILHPHEEPKYANPNMQINPEEERMQKCFIRKKATLCLLRIFRTDPEMVDVSEWADRMVMLLEDSNLGVVTSSMSLLLGFASSNPMQYDGLVPYVVEVLNRLVLNKSKTAHPNYNYYGIPSPWLQVKCLRFLQYFRPPTIDDILQSLITILGKILNAVPVADNLNKSNAEHSVLFEAINLIIAYGADADEALHLKAISLLGKFISIKDANIRYLGLDAMARMARQDGPASGQEHQDAVIVSLKDADISVRKRALDLLFVLTDGNNCELIVRELLDNLTSADSGMKENMVVKIAILSEKYAKNLHWYVDTMVSVILTAGDFVSEDVWHRIVHIITNNPNLHEYSAEKMIGIVQSKYAHEAAVALAGYILGEFGVNICEKQGMSGYDQFAALHQHFTACSLKVQALLLTTYVKIQNTYPDCADIISDIFKKYAASGHLDLQQRACEYLRLSTLQQDLKESVLDNMPVYSDAKASALESRLSAGEDATQDKSVWKANREVRPHLNESEPAQNLSKQVDLLNMDDSFDSNVSSAPSSAVIGLTTDDVPNLKKWFNSVPLAGPGQPATLFENELIKVTVVAEYRAHQGRMSVLVYNKGDNISDFKIDVPTVDYVNIRKQDAGNRIGISEQAKMMLAIDCVKPFSDAPEIIFSFSVGSNRYLYPLRLPLTAAAFFEPVVLDKNTYMAQWKALEGENREVQDVFVSASQITPQLMSFLREKVVAALRLGIAPGLDTNELTVTACCSFKTGSAGPDGNMISVGAMMRIEADVKSNRFRITARAKHPTIAAALANVVKAQLV